MPMLTVGKVYAIRHKPTGFFMPDPKGRAGRGSSWWEPEQQAEQIRLFHYKRSAEGALTQWLKGKHEAHYSWETDDFSGASFQYQDGTSIIACPHRQRGNMEVVAIELCAEAL